MNKVDRDIFINDRDVDLLNFDDQKRMNLAMERTEVAI